MEVEIGMDQVVAYVNLTPRRATSPHSRSPGRIRHDDLLDHSVTYRIAVGPKAGHKAFTLQTVPAREQDKEHPNLAKTVGSSMHASVAANAHERREHERLCRFIAHPAVVTDRLALTPQGNVRYTLKTRYRGGTTDIILEPTLMYRRYGMPRARDARERPSPGRLPWCQT